MNTATESVFTPPIVAAHPLLDNKSPGISATLLFIGIILAGLSYVGYQLVQEVNSSTVAAPWPSR